MSSIPDDTLLWCRPVMTGHVMYVSEQLLDHGARSPWKTAAVLAKVRAVSGT